MNSSDKNELVFYNSNGVKVTDSRFISGSKTYAMRNLSSVSVGVVNANRTGPGLLFAFGILLLLFDGTMVVGAIAAILGLIFLISAKDKYTVKISSNSGEVNGYESTDKGTVEDMVESVNDAIVSLSKEQINPIKVEGNDDTISQLEKLAKLKETGVLTDSEFEEQKAKILNS